MIIKKTTQFKICGLVLFIISAYAIFDLTKLGQFSLLVFITIFLAMSCILVLLGMSFILVFRELDEFDNEVNGRINIKKDYRPLVL